MDYEKTYMRNVKFWLSVIRNLKLKEYVALLQAIQDYNDMKVK